MKHYEVLLLTLDGQEWQTEGRDCQTVEDAIRVSADMGSRWIFYPIHFIIRQHNPNYHNLADIDRQRIIEPPDILPFLKGKTVKTARKFLQENPIQL